MDSKLKELLKENNLSLQLLPIEGKGFIMSSPTDDPKDPDVIVVNSNLSDEEMEKVVLHEVGHAKNDDVSCDDYKISYITRLISENGANDFLIKQKVKQFVALNNEPLDANYVNLADSIGIDDYMKVKEELAKYITKEK